MGCKRDRAAAVAGLIALAVQVAAPAALAAADPPSDPAQLNADLKKVEKALGEGDARRRDLDRLADSVEDELQRLRRELVRAAEATQDREAELTAVESKLAELKAQQAESAVHLNAKKQQLAQVSGALRRLAARPPVAMVASPADPLDTVHTAMLLGAVVPQLQHEAGRLAADIARHAALEKNILAEKKRLAEASANLDSERVRVAALLEEKQAARKSMVKERTAVVDRLNALAASARDLRDLMEKIERHQAEGSAARERLNRIVGNAPADPSTAEPSAESAIPPSISPPVPLTKPALGPEFIARLPDVPSIASAKGDLTFPAAGRISQHFGAANRLGLTEQGVVIATRDGAQVVAPYDGKVVYAGAFRGYGQIVMIEHDDGYLTLMAGMSVVDVQVGQGVLAGEPVALMGAIGDGADGTEGLYVEFRHNGAPLDPLPWWSARTNKVRR